MSSKGIELSSTSTLAILKFDLVHFDNGCVINYSIRARAEKTMKTLELMFAEMEVTEKRWKSIAEK